MQRKLSGRHMQMIALGGTIGVGLFMGASATIKWTGPSVLIAYIIAGLFLYLIMRALGEMLYVDPATGSFAKFASEYMHPLFGYLTAWSNIFQFVVVGMSEMIAIGEYFKFWWPGLPAWLPGLVAITFLVLANLISVRMFGELEFWFALIKVVTIVLMIIAGLGVILFGLGNGGRPVGISNLWTHGGFSRVALLAFALPCPLCLVLTKALSYSASQLGKRKTRNQQLLKRSKTPSGEFLSFTLVRFS